MRKPVYLYDEDELVTLGGVVSQGTPGPSSTDSPATSAEYFMAQGKYIQRLRGVSRIQVTGRVPKGISTVNLAVIR